MREMKDSGITWIGEIGRDYRLFRLKNICHILDEFRKPITADQRNQDADILYDYYGASGIIDKIDGYTILRERNTLLILTFLLDFHAL